MGNQPDTSEEHSNETVDKSLLPHLKKKYLMILILLGVIAVMLPSYLHGIAMVASYVILLFLAAVMLGLYTDYYFQKLHRKCRPFIVASIAKRVALIRAAAAIIWTIPSAMTTGERIPYGVFWLLCAAVVWNHFQIFVIAKQHKRKYPDRCEFC